MELAQYLTNPWMWAIVALIVFAGLDLMVGVANDAVNFLNSAIGSKVASKKTIYRVAALGIFVGASFSEGMMEVARKGIFNPAMFTFYDIMIVFFSVVMADVILLDVYNSLKLPTSTTVSVVFELLGAGLAIAFIHLVKNDLALSALGGFINASSTISIVTGIFMSVGIAFVSGWLIQTVIRSLVSFDYEKSIRHWGWALGGFSISVITYFLVVKGLKEATWLPDLIMDWVKGHTWNTLGILFILWSIVSLIIQKIFKGDILKVIVLVGTFALAAAFAGNDLVNFIGVSVAGYQSVMLYLAQGGDVTQFMMGGLAVKVATPQIFLFGSALIMIATLMWSKKAQSVTETEIGLTRHATGQEQFKPGKISRWLVKKSITTHAMIVHLLPLSWQKSVAGRFIAHHKDHHDNAPAFDLVRASINLTLSAVLIAIATNMKLPLSTTYVTFMVAMGTALADGAWGRDSAVYRISGVLTIIGSWLMTAVIALGLTLILTVVLWNLGFGAVAIATVLVGYLLYRSHRHVDDPTTHADDDQLLSANNLSDLIHHHSMKILPSLKLTLSKVITGMIEDNEDVLTDTYHQATKLASKTKVMKLDIHIVFAKLGGVIVETGHTYVQSIEVLRKAALSLTSLAEQCQEYTLNKHPDLIHEQTKELHDLQEQMDKFLHHSITMIEKSDFDAIDRFDERVAQLIDDLDTTKQLQFARIKAGDAGVRNTTLYIGMMTELHTIVITIQKLVHYVKRMK